MPQDLYDFVWFAVGLLVGSLATWALIRRRFDDIALQRRQVEEIRELEKQLHLQECKWVDSLAAQKRELLAAHEVELQEAVASTRMNERAEFERQVNSFSVKVSPYVRLSKSEGLWRRHVHSASGYQYQLFVNGVPAFAPHVEITNTETATQIDEERLLRLASQAAEVAVQCAGVASKFVRLAGPVIVRQLGKKSIG